jgi:hypothetical protein
MTIQAGIDTAVHGEGGADPIFVLRAQSVDQVMDLQGSLDGPDRIIFVNPWDAES